MKHQLNSREFTASHCWQYEIRQKNLAQDLEEAELTHAEIDTLRVSDFEFQFVSKEDKETCQKVKDFILRHEWLGKMPHRPTHRFIATYQGKLAGVIVMATPNAFSNLLGKEYRDKEKLISRGACISWSPKNLASALVMFSIRWMVKNTPYRFFTAYSDTEARELGTIYQACNFIYLGQDSGARFEYFDKKFSDKGFSDRVFRKTTSFKLYAQELGISWQNGWSHRDKIFWDKVPSDIAQQLKKKAREYQNSIPKRSLPRKHKYVYILGLNKTETKKLRGLFVIRNPDKLRLPYPKDRAPKNSGPSERPLTERPTLCWPTSVEQTPTKRLYSIKEVARMYGISQWLIYHHIKSDPTFPYVNVGVKKKYLIGPEKLDQWLRDRTQKHMMKEHHLPSSHELLEMSA
ncbi:MAG: helix-turn-helix transcriptional regulator [Bacteriovoracia bacterium]